MRLIEITLQRFRNIVSPQVVSIENDVTGLIGKNESGKTTILRALHRLNPANDVENKFDLTIEYPRWRLAPDRRKDPDLGRTCPVSAIFELDDADRAAVGAAAGIALPAGTRCVGSRSYDDSLYLSLDAPVADRVRAAGADAEIPTEELEPLLALDSIDEVRAAIRERAKELKADDKTALVAKALTSVNTALGKLAPLDEDNLSGELFDALKVRLPKFFYFANYQSLPGEIDLFKLAEKVEAGTRLLRGEETVVALLAYAGEEPKDFLDENYDSRKAELQSASRDLSRRAFEYWKQNTDLSVIFDTDMVEVGRSMHDDEPIRHRFLKIELRDARHGDVETNFATRSSGFQWFFSFFAAFSAYQESKEDLIVLLDEPGTSLHGEAQKDFIRFLNDELGSEKQTIYTTHSQYLIDPTKYEKLRAVNDRATRDDPDLGVEITKVDLSADADTVLPVESALGYSISHHLFIGAGHHLAVEGSSDFVYAQRITEHLIAAGRAGLDPRLAMIPVGGAGNMPAFVALLGRRLKVSALIDGDRTNAKATKVLAAAEANGIPASAIVTCSETSEGLTSNADIEDLFAVEDYLRLYNWAFDAQVQVADLADTSEPILRRLNNYTGEFDHALPAHALTNHREEFFASVSPTTIERFEALFEKLNSTLETAAD
jgi:energy-coupling factor transporter ATP-binding protein EcfA2